MKQSDKEKDIKEKHDAKQVDESKKSEGQKNKEKAAAFAGLEKAAAQAEDPEKVFESDPKEVAGPTREANLPPSEEELGQKQIECDKDGCEELKHSGEIPAEGVVDGKPVKAGLAGQSGKAPLKK